MTKLHQIENTIMTLEGGKFQVLCDAYLHARGYEHISRGGSVLGTDKTKKGTPDSYIALPNGKYIFVEYTTQLENLAKKLQDDLKKCFDANKTGIPINQIEEIVMCFVGELDTQERNELVVQCQTQGCRLTLIGIGELSLDLYQKYPHITSDILHIEVDTRQILTADDFVTTYNQNQLAAPLDLEFHFREEELAQAAQALTKFDLLIVSGTAGVGKTRFALECCNQFVASHANYQVYCLLNRDLPLYSDLEHYFSAEGHYIILVDDANRFQQRNLIFDLIRKHNVEHKVKIVLTVRDYALTVVQKAALEATTPFTINLEKLDSNQIRTLIHDELGITNTTYLDRIAAVAQGNPRLAVTAARVAKEQNNLTSIANVATIYDAYFSSVLKDIKDLNHARVLPVAAVIALFQYIDRTNTKFVAEIASMLGMSSEEFWDRVEQLHNLEVLDLYDHEVARFSDQVLATYITYLVFFVEGLAELGTFLDRYFFTHSHLTDIIFANLNAFDTDVIIDRLRTILEPIWRQVQENNSATLALVQAFWFVDPTHVLMYLDAQIDLMPAVPFGTVPHNLAKANQLGEHSLLTILGYFTRGRFEDFKIALELVFKYLERRADETSKILLCLIDNFGINTDSAIRSYEVQRLVISELAKRVQGDTLGIYPLIFLQVASKYLKTNFLLHRLEDRNVVRIAAMKLRLTPKLEALRLCIWQQIFELAQTPDYKDAALRILLNYSVHWPDVSVAEIVKFDSELVLPFITRNLTPEDFFHSWVVQNYLDLLERNSVEFATDLRGTFTNHKLELANVLLFDRAEMRELGWKEYERLRFEQLRNYFAHFTLGDYGQMLETCVEAMEVIDKESHGSQMRATIGQVLSILFETNPRLYVEIIKTYLDSEDRLHLYPGGIVSRLIIAAGTAEAYHIINHCVGLIRLRWLFAFYIVLPRNQITTEHLEQLYCLYRQAPWDSIPQETSYLANYTTVDEKIIKNVAYILVEREDDRAAYVLDNLFNPHFGTFNMLRESFADDIELFERIYLLVCRQINHTDHDGRLLNLLLVFDQNFVTEYLQIIWQWNDGFLNRNHDYRSYHFIWERADYEEVMMKAVTCLLQLQQEGIGLLNNYLQVFFSSNAGEPRLFEDVEPKLIGFLSLLITRFASESNLMSMVFDVALHIFPRHYAQLISEFLRVNEQFEAFEQLPYRASVAVAWGSVISEYEKSIEFLESLIPVLHSLRYLRHRHLVTQRIQHYRQLINDEQRRQFTRSD